MNKDQFLRISRVAADYYRQSSAAPEPRHFEAWLNSLNGPMGSYFRKEGFEACKNAVDFRRFVAEQNGGGLEEHMRRHLSGGDYQAWRTRPDAG